MLTVDSDFAGSDTEVIYKNTNIPQTKGSVSLFCSMFFL